MSLESGQTDDLEPAPNFGLALGPRYGRWQTQCDIAREIAPRQ
jgi:hypothetical protein